MTEETEPLAPAPTDTPEDVDPEPTELGDEELLLADTDNSVRPEDGDQTEAQDADPLDSSATATGVGGGAGFTVANVGAGGGAGGAGGVVDQEALQRYLDERNAQAKRAEDEARTVNDQAVRERQQREADEAAERAAATGVGEPGGTEPELQPKPKSKAKSKTEPEEAPK